MDANNTTMTVENAKPHWAYTIKAVDEFRGITIYGMISPNNIVPKDTITEEVYYQH